MSRYVRVNDSDYKLTVDNGGTIKFDTSGGTGGASGEVIVTGDLIVLGNTTTVDTANLTIEDNIILLNKGESGSGVTEDTAGIQIDRGSLNDAQFLFDENISYDSPTSGPPIAGGFVIKDTSGQLLGLRTNVIDTDGGTLILIGKGTGVVSVSGTEDYENQVLDDDDIPNKKYIDDEILTIISENPPNRIFESDSKLEINDASLGGTTDLILTLDNVISASWTSTIHEIYDLRFTENKVIANVSNTDLELISDGIGSVVIDDKLKLKLAALVPSSSIDGIKIYASSEEEGGTGVFFVNTEGTRDEFISRSKAIVYSMIF